MTDKKKPKRKTIEPLPKSEPYPDTYAERIAELLLPDEPTSLIKEQAGPWRNLPNVDHLFSDNGYIQSIEDSQKWAEGILPPKEYAKASPYEFKKFMKKVAEIQASMPKATKMEANEKIGRVELVIDPRYQNALGPARKKIAKLYTELKLGRLQEIAFQGGPSNSEWFAAQMTFYFQDLDNARVTISELLARKKNDPSYETTDAEVQESLENAIRSAFRIGFLRQDSWWKFHYQDVVKSQMFLEQKRDEGSAKGGKVTLEKSKERRLACLDYVRPAVHKFGIVFGMFDRDKQAKIIREFALKDRPDYFGRGERPLSEKWFLEKLDWLSSAGMLGDAIDVAIQNKA